MFPSLRCASASFARGTLVLTFAAMFAIPAHAVQALPKCCVWRITNAKAPFYLVGSVHALDEDDYPLPAPYEIALKDAKRFLFEFDPIRSAEFEKKLAAAAKYPPGEDLRSKIHPELLAWLRQNVLAVNDHRLRGKKSQTESFDSGLGYKPWWIAQHLVDKSSYSNDVSASPGLDDYFLARGQKMGKEIGGLESVDEHVAVIGGMSDRDGEIMLRDALVPHKNSEAEFNRMRKAWRTGDTAALWAGDARFRGEAPRIAARFVDERNHKWIPRIEAELKSGRPTAVVVGALHFAGPNSVLKLLEKRGYKIEQL
jgi:uncharacterized protein YbaP (TraB family)